MPEPRFTPGAQQDLKEIWDFTFRRWDVSQADAYIANIVATCQSLAEGILVGR